MSFEALKSERGWPSKVLSFNPTLRLTAGLNEMYSKLMRWPPLVGHANVHTLEDGRLWLSTAMPLLNHRYRYVRTLSESDMSQIICAVDTYFTVSTFPLVAIKLMNAQHWALGAQEYERLRRLWKALLKDGGEVDIVRPRACFEQGNHFCIVFDLLTGLEALTTVQRTPALSSTLSSLPGFRAKAPRRPVLSISALRHVATNMLGALMFLRSQGVVHGDVKPDNIMVEVRPPQTFGAFALPFMKLIDFSNAMQLDETHAYHDSFDVATPSYRAPELVYGTKFGCPVDMWAAGITLAELFCGRTLITPDTRCGLAMQIAQLLGQPPPGIFERSRFAAELFACVADTPSTFGVQQMRQRFSGSLGASMCQEQQFFMDFLAKILRCT